jgi:hypothetical protein
MPTLKQHAKAPQLGRLDESVRRVLHRFPTRREQRAHHFRRRMQTTDIPEASMWVQIVVVAIVAVVFLVRLVFALYDQPSKPRN